MDIIYCWGREAQSKREGQNPNTWLTKKVCQHIVMFPLNTLPDVYDQWDCLSPELIFLCLKNFIP